jgi:hypothetical protein
MKSILVLMQVDVPEGEVRLAGRDLVRSGDSNKEE